MHDRIHVIIECDILECKRTAHVNKRVAKVNGNYGKSSIYLVEPSYVCFEIMREKKLGGLVSNNSPGFRRFLCA